MNHCYFSQQSVIKRGAEGLQSNHAPNTQHTLNMSTAAQAVSAPSRSDKLRFLSKINPAPNEKGCREWMAYKNSGGYGEFFMGKKLKATRVAFAIYHGLCPADVEICHTCDNPQCVAEDHLYAGTHLKNMQDRSERGRQVTPSGLRHGRYTKPQRTARGERNGAARFKAWQIQSIRQLNKQGVSRKEIAIKFQATPSQISKICLRQIWAEVPDVTP